MEKVDTKTLDMEDQFKLTRRERTIYSLVNFPNIILSGIFSLTYVNFFWDDLGLQQILFTLGQVIYAIVNSVNDFYGGRISDKTDFKKWGSRRLVYIKWGGLLWAFLFFSMWFPWSYNNQIIIFIHFVVSICAFDMLLSLVWLVWMALMPELTESTKERNQMALNNQLFLIIGALPVLLSFLIYEMGLLTFQIYAGICALISAICYFYAGSKLEERPELYEDQVDLGLITAIKEVISNRSFLSVTSFRVFYHINMSLGLSFVFAYFYIFGVDYILASLLYYLLSTVVALIGYLIYKRLSEKYEMRTLMIYGGILQIIFNIIGFFVILPRELEILIWLFLIMNFIAQGYVLFDYPVLSLVTDSDEVQNNKRREGLILGTNAFFLKIGESIGPIFGTSILLLFGFIRNAPSQDFIAIVGIKFLLLIVQSIFILLGVISLYYFPLHGKELGDLRKKIAEIHEKKSEKYSWKGQA
ncbi:MAG: MFS transporter [Candidatus Lokiarchaeota archaeon]|nr:MFS transporter [Candidatus Lokiarchaeota archaeon]MBD3199508.1 MFS transporter [Candidatus Lokiarchaeota archaeon]